MKSWQHGYEIDYLKELASKYEHYNSFTLSPFVQVKKNNIAECLYKGTLKIIDENTMIDVTVSKSVGSITMHGNTVIAKKQKDDITFTKLTGNKDLLKNKLNEYIDNNCWLYVWAEDKDINDFAIDCNFCVVGPKITTFGEMYNIYYRGKPRPFPTIDLAEYESIKKITDVNVDLIDRIAEKLNTLPEFTNHYSNYNKDNSWSALSLRGYTSDPSFITKPIEMSDKWKEKNKDTDFFLQDTPLYEQFPEVRELLEDFNHIHRVRLMRLKPGGGELERHTDQVDPDSGGSFGKLARLHYPIKTNERVIFTVYHTNGSPRVVHMKKGECWFLDTRKLHMAITGGDEERIHLVVAVIPEGKRQVAIIR